MPIYEYLCDTCNDRFEQLVLTSKAAEVHCPKCEGEKVHKVYSTFAAQSKQGAMDSGGFCEPAGGGMCGAGMCGTGGCSMN